MELGTDRGDLILKGVKNVKIEWNRRYTTIAVYAILVLVFGVLFLYGVQNYREVKAWFSAALVTLRPFIFGFVIAYLLNPIYVFLDKKFLPWLTNNTINPPACRGLAIIVTYALTGGVLYLFSALVFPQIIISVSSIIGNLRSYADSLQQLLDMITHLVTVDGMPPEIVHAMEMSVENVINQIYDLELNSVPHVLDYAMNFTSGLFSLIIGIIISIYMFMGKERFLAQSRKVMYALFNEENAKFMIDLASESNAIFGGFITGKIIDSLIIGILCFIGMWILKMPYVVLVSVIVGVTNVIPYFGPFIGAIPSIIIILTESPLQALIFAIFVLLLQQFDGNILGPMILGDTTGLSAFWVIFAILIFGKFLGFAGMFIGVPVFAVVYSVIKKFIAIKLQKKGLPSETAAYADDPSKL